MQRLKLHPTTRRRLLTTLLRLTPLLATRLKPHPITQQRLLIILQQLTPLLAIIPQLAITTMMPPTTQLLLLTMIDRLIPPSPTTSSTPQKLFIILRQLIPLLGTSTKNLVTMPLHLIPLLATDTNLLHTPRRLLTKLRQVTTSPALTLQAPTTWSLLPVITARNLPPITKRLSRTHQRQHTRSSTTPQQLRLTTRSSPFTTPPRLPIMRSITPPQLLPTTPQLAITKNILRTTPPQHLHTTPQSLLATTSPKQLQLITMKSHTTSNLLLLPAIIQRGSLFTTMPPVTTLPQHLLATVTNLLPITAANHLLVTATNLLPTTAANRLRVTATHLARLFHPLTTTNIPHTRHIK